MSIASMLTMNPAATDAWTNKTAAPMAASGTSSSSSSSASSDSATITANDFLTLLVTEMKNQDPTADTDPNEYINQLVQVNSLQQLIGINQTLTGALSSSPSSSSSTPSNYVAQSPGVSASSIAANTLAGSGSTAASTAASRLSHVTQNAAGNLGLPAPNASALGVARALDGSAPVLKDRAANLPR